MAPSWALRPWVVVQVSQEAGLCMLQTVASVRTVKREGESERERERDRDRSRERDRERQTREREGETERDIESYRERERETTRNICPRPSLLWRGCAATE